MDIRKMISSNFILDCLQSVSLLFISQNNTVWSKKSTLDMIMTKMARSIGMRQMVGD